MTEYLVTYKLGILSATDEYPTLETALARARELLLAFQGMSVTIHRLEQVA